MPRRFLAWIPILAFCLFTFTPAQAATETMPVSQLREGMKGVGKTVISGTLIQDFDVEIIGILERGGFNGGPMVLVRGSGPVLDATGGFAGGYSGSPVYIDGKMIGAISAAWYFADHSVAGITPIGEMLKNFGYPAQNEGLVTGKPVPLAKAIDLEGTALDMLQIAWPHTPSEAEVAANAANGVMQLTPCKTPLFINGLNPQLIERIKTELGPQMPFIDIMPGLGPAAATGGFGTGNSSIDLFSGLEPGSAIGAQLVSGDIDMTAIGTLTYVDENSQILAFGHPFMQVGAVELPMTKARIVHTMKSIERSFKMGESTGLVGTINQDRASAISGTLGQMPDMIPFSLTVKDADLDRTRRYNYSVVNYESILPFLGMLPPMQGLGEVMDRQGPATIATHFKILTESLDPIERTNLFYDQFSGVGLLELVQGLFILTTQNIFEDVQIREVQLEIEVTQNRQTTDIIKAEIKGDAIHGTPDVEVKPDEPTERQNQPIQDSQAPEPKPLQGGEMEMEYYTMAPASVEVMEPGEIQKFLPGDRFTVEIHLKPYRAEEEIRHLTIDIPKDMPLGQTTVEIRGGGRLPSIFQMAAEAQGLPPGFMPQIAGPVAPAPPQSLEALVEQFLDREKMNELVVELYRPASATGGSGDVLNSAKQSANRKNAASSGGEEGIRDFAADAIEAEELEPIKIVVDTDRVIFGSVMLPIEIVSKDKPQESPKSEDTAKSEKQDDTDADTDKKSDERKRNRGRGDRFS